MESKEKLSSKQDMRERQHLDVLYGCVNAIMCVPVMISFTSIIFRDPAFAPHLPQLVKLVLFSSMIHQICFSIFSSLPFAVGQVQDAGLIFLSAMADSVVDGCKNGCADNGKILPTTLAVLAAAAARSRTTRNRIWCDL